MNGIHPVLHFFLLGQLLGPDDAVQHILKLLGVIWSLGLPISLAGAHIEGLKVLLRSFCQFKQFRAMHAFLLGRFGSRTNAGKSFLVFLLE